VAEDDSQKILIVDDEATNLQVIARVFEAMQDKPYEILQTLSSEKAFEIALAEQPDLIITDWDMPVVDGIELIRRLRSDPATRDILVIMCTGVMTTSQNLRTALDVGAVDYIRKPVDDLELIARTRSMLQLAATMKRMRTQNEELRASHARMEWMARTDMLTELSNRRDFLEKLDREIAAATRHDRNFVLAMVDIDDFKSVNDRHGHHAGDAVLVALSALLREAIRADDLVARWGGEEFILLFSDTDLEGGRVIAEKVRKRVADHSFEFEGNTLRVSVSIGACAFDGRSDVDTLLRLADEALYEGKTAGRNTVVVRH